MWIVHNYFEFETHFYFQISKSIILCGLYRWFYYEKSLNASIFRLLHRNFVWLHFINNDIFFLNTFFTLLSISYNRRLFFLFFFIAIDSNVLWARYKFFVYTFPNLIEFVINVAQIKDWNFHWILIFVLQLNTLNNVIDRIHNCWTVWKVHSIIWNHI